MQHAAGAGQEAAGSRKTRQVWAFVQARGTVTRTEVGDTLGMGLETPDRWCLSP